MTRRPATPLHAARRQAAKELELPADDWRVVRLATLVVAHEVLQAKLATGAMIDVGYLLQLDNAIAEVRATSAPAPSLQLKICQTLTGICPHCKAEVDLGRLPPIDNKPAPASSSSPAFNPPNPAKAPTPTFGADNVVPIDPIGKNKARDIHGGRWSAQKGCGAAPRPSDPYVGGFSVPNETRDPHRVDQALPTSLRPPKDAS
jgi:hypothetical protein